MQYLDVVLAIIALFGLCSFFHKVCRLPSALTPLTAVSVTMLWFSFAGVLNVLYPAGLLFYLAGYGLGIFSFCKKEKQIQQTVERVKFSMLTPGFIFFWLTVIVCFFYFACRKPVFFEWDEFSFWGTASKLMKLNDAIYTTGEIAWDWIPSQMPGLISFGYFVQFFGEGFAPWKVLLAYNIVFFAMYAAAMASFSFRQYHIVVPVGLIGLLTPYFITVYTRIIEPSYIYMSSLGDIPAGIMFGAVLCFYFNLRNMPDTDGKKTIQGLWAVWLVLGAASLFKDNTFVIQLVAAGIIAVDLFVFYKPKAISAPWKKMSFRIGSALSVFVAVALPYVLWIKYIGMIASRREAAGQMGNTSLPLSEVVIRGFHMLFCPEARSDRFNLVLTDMLEAMKSTRIFGLGSGLLLIGFILTIFIITAVCSKDKLHRKRTWLAMFLSTGGFIGYYWVLILSYTFIFREIEAINLASYNRYVQSYYLGWFIMAVILMAIGAKNSRPYGILKIGVIALSCGMLLLESILVQPQMSVLGYSDSHFYSTHKTERISDEIRDTIPNDGKIFYVNQADNGLGFFKYCYALLPYQMDLSFGGGEIGIPENDTGGLYYHDEYLPLGAKKGEEKPLDLQGLRNYLTERECKYIFTDQLDDNFVILYQDLFTDHLAAAQTGEAILYRKCEGEPLRYEPLMRPAERVTEK